MQGIPGELHERPWLDFAHNRNEALSLARPKGDYLMFIDADEQLEVPPGFSWPALSADGYTLTCRLNGWEYQRNTLAAAHIDWSWEGVLHEYLTAPQHGPWQKLQGPAIRVSHDGARARNPHTYLSDIALLRQAVQDAPDNARNVFYLAQSFRDAGLLEDSLRWYLHRAGMDGWEEERWHAMFQAALLQERLGASPAEVREAYLAAYAARPARAEPLCELARFHRMREEYAVATLFGLQAAGMVPPEDTLFVDMEVYAWRALDELAVSAFYTPHRELGRAALQQLLRKGTYPASESARIESNRTHYGF